MSKIIAQREDRVFSSVTEEQMRILFSSGYLNFDDKTIITSLKRHLKHTIPKYESGVKGG